ncbi:hypothetical protein [Candidatus Poriferisodalis sp.]|uniref:hypothetical protein n=1 Tax=Candidatus Poriferisodalis sp. TaxID=3101277 RepID=UPI003B01F510
MAISRQVLFVDTSVLLRLIGTDGDDAAREIASEFEQRSERGQQFVIPVTAVIEAGNRIAQRASDRRRLAERLARVLKAASSAQPPWVVRATTWNRQFVDELLDGNSTGTDLITLVGDGRLGSGDVAILVERDQFQRSTAHVDVRIWSLDDTLAAYG